MDLNYRSVQQFCGSIDISTDRPNIDLSGIKWIEPYAVVYLGMYLRHYNSQGKYFHIDKVNTDVHTYLAKQNFWKRFNFAIDPDKNKALIRTYQTTSFGDIIDIEPSTSLAEDIELKLVNLLEGESVRVAIDDCAIAITELIDNFSQHSSVILGAMMVQYYPRLHKFSVALADCGKGIRSSLLKSGKYPSIASMSHKEAIAEAFRPGVTCKQEGGMGFYEVSDTIIKYNGKLFLSSYNGGLYIDTDGKVYSIDIPYSLPGVQVELTFYER